MFKLTGLFLLLCGSLNAQGPISISGGGGGGGVSTLLYSWSGIAQIGVSGWNLSYDALSNIVAGTVDATHIFPTWVVTANTTGNAFRQYITVNKSVTSVIFNLAVASTGAASGSMTLAYACVGNGSAYDNPSQTALSAITLSSLTATKKVYTSTQSVTCDGSTLPKTLVVWWTATAPSDATLILIDGGVTL